MKKVGSFIVLPKKASEFINAMFIIFNFLLEN